MAGCRYCGVALLAVVMTVAAAPQTRTLASVWYRGKPAGVPRQMDIDAIAAAGFSAVTWPRLQVSGAMDLRRMAEAAGLQVVIRTEPVPLTSASAQTPDTHVDILVPQTPVPQYPALMWRAVAHGAKVISFDAGAAEGNALLDQSGRPAAWVEPASAVARQLVRNATMIDLLTAGPIVRVEPQASGLDVTLLDARRSWVLMATNVSPPGTPPADTYVFLPRPVPPAEWLNLFDGSTISMLRRPTDVRWHVVLGPGDVRVYVIGKIEALTSLRPFRRTRSPAFAPRGHQTPQSPPGSAWWP